MLSEKSKDMEKIAHLNDQPADFIPAASAC
jgi:hypothetical protein